MHINIRNTYGTETVDNKIIEKLYNILYGGDDPENDTLVVDNTSNVVGSLNCNILYKYKYDLLTSDFTNLFINYNDLYLYIKDPYVKSVLLANNFGDDYGVYMSIATTTTSVPKFGGTQSAYNNEIVSFDELQYFRNVTTLTDTFMYVGSQFESVDLRNITRLNRAFYWCGIHNCKNAGNVEFIGSQCLENTNELVEFDFSSVLNMGWLSLSDSKLTEIHFGGSSNIVLSDSNNIINNTLLTTIDGLENMTTMPSGSAFAGNILLQRINLASVIGNIPYRLFNNCNNIEYINMPLASGTINAEAFNRCYKLETLNIDYENIEYIYNDAFFMCQSLTSLSFPNCTYVDHNAFHNCSLLQTINIPNCETIGWEAFMDCTALTSINISSVTTPDFGLFNGCTNLETITGLSNLMQTGVGHRIFFNCKKLIFPEILVINTSYIGYGAFYNCSNLRKVQLSSNVKKLYRSVFDSCTNLIEVQGLENITHISGGIFENAENLEGTINLCNTIDFADDIRVYNVVQGESDHMFRNCKKIKKVILGHIPHIRADEFSSQTVPFCNCLSLHTVDISSIDDFHFNHNMFFCNCPLMTNFILRCTTVPTVTIGPKLSMLTIENIMSNSNGKIFVPDSAINDYKTAQYWSDIADYIYPLSEYVPIVD